MVHYICVVLGLISKGEDQDTTTGYLSHAMHLSSTLQINTHSKEYDTIINTTV